MQDQDTTAAGAVSTPEAIAEILEAAGAELMDERATGEALHRVAGYVAAALDMTAQELRAGHPVSRCRAADVVLYAETLHAPGRAQP